MKKHILVYLICYLCTIPLAYSQVFTTMSESAISPESIKSNGCSWGYNYGDSTLTLFVANSYSENLLYHYDDDSKELVNVAPNLGIIGNIISNSASWGDYNRDKYLDLFVAKDGANNLYLYDSTTHKFEDKAFYAFSSNDEKSRSGSWADYNNDGYLDLFISNVYEYENKQGTITEKKSVLYRNNEGESFEDLTSFAEIEIKDETYGVSWGDFNNDNFPDLFVAKSGKDNLFVNNSNGKFSPIDFQGEEGDKVSRGGSWIDVNNDCELDLFVTNYDSEKPSNDLYFNNGDETFTLKPFPGVQPSICSSWGDYDNDGDLDLVITNEKNIVLYINNGDPQYAFTDTDTLIIAQIADTVSQLPPPEVVA